MLIEPPYPGAIGEGAYQYINAADMTNKGVELVSYLQAIQVKISVTR